MKYYAVKVGNNPGLFDNWAECQESIKGFSGAVYKSFNSKEEAEAFLSDRDIWGEQIAADIEQGYLVAFCERPSQTLCKPPMWCRIEAPHRRYYIWPERIVPQKKMHVGKKSENCCKRQM